MLKKISGITLAILSISLNSCVGQVSNNFKPENPLNRADLNFNNVTTGKTNVKIPFISGKVEFTETNLSPSIDSKSVTGDVNTSSLSTHLSPFTSHFSTKATINDIAPQASVSLIYPSDYSNSALRNSTIATGLTNNNGQFIINSTFFPSIGDIFILEARKRLGGDGTPVLCLKTFVKWTGTSWTSITGNNIYINAKTTAVCIMSGYDSSILPTSDAIEKFTVSNGLTVTGDINNNVNIAKIAEIEGLVNSSILNNEDPIEKIKYVNYYLKYNTTSVSYFNFEKAPFTGKVYDPNGLAVEGVKVSVRSLDPGLNWSAEDQLTIADGSYIFRNAPVGAIILITVAKDGWASRRKAEIIKSTMTSDPNINIFDFSGMYAIQDEPEITSIKVNTKLATRTGPAIKPNQAELSESVANTTGLANDALTLEVTFSEPVNQLSFENNFRITSQLFTLMGNIGFIIDKTTPGVTFEWGIDRKSVTFRTNKAILANQEGTEARYMIDFGAPFKDDTEKESLTGKFIRFSPGIQGDFVVFSFANNPSNP